MLIDAGLRDAVFAHFRFWDAIADSINPLLGLSLLVVAVRMRRDSSRQALGFLAQSVLALVLCWVCVRVLRELHLGAPGTKFPSGHMAFAVSAATSLAFWKRRTLWLLVPLLVFYAWLMVALRFHNWMDIMGALILAFFVSWCCGQRTKASQTIPEVHDEMRI
jgi:membrane-associated phospholipid phosphatase